MDSNFFDIEVGEQIEVSRSRDRQYLEYQFKKEELDSKKQDREQRKLYSYCIFWFLCAYMVVVFVIVILTGSNVLLLSDTVLGVLLGTTTTNIITLMVIVARYLFPSH